MKLDELVAKLVENYGQLLLQGGLSPEHLQGVLHQAWYTFASILASDLVIAGKLGA